MQGGPGGDVVQAVSVAFADSHPLIVDGLVNIVSDREEYRLVATGRSLSDALDIVRQRSPDILVLEPAMEGRSFECISHIANTSTTRVIVFTSLSGVEPAIQALDAGAKAYTLKSNPADEILVAVAAACRGDTYITPAFATKVILALRSKDLRKETVKPIKLSIREQKIIQMLLMGRTNREIGRDLTISEKTVKHYMTILMQKLHVRNRLEVLIAAQKLASDEATRASYVTDHVH
jgi:DNA-binding NarL/FixJ family response regulator